MFYSRFAAVAATLALAVISGCSKDSDPQGPELGVFSVEMDHLVGTRDLNLDTDTYTTTAGDNFKVSTFKYYVSNVQLRKADNSAYSVPDSYFLIDQAKPGSKTLSFADVPAGDYTGISFVVGVDSARTKAGAYTGVLDASNGMWWDWSQEFINVKLEGTSPQSPRGGLVFHIAGFKGANGANNTIRTVSLPFPASTKLLVRKDHTPEMHVHVNVLGMFEGPNPVRFATVNNTMGGAPSVRVADNIAAGMFAVDHIHAN
ncbi:MbnP family protein [Hymenobacter sp.]|uniref:MbnP family protein n=1 Tax=Hymenobacter sp. TaxID=1898978 RepID=UPI00286BC446|nr:MbnP family protein [Hymenobacter sp.]